jgi:hypothetical protein
MCYKGVMKQDVYLSRPVKLAARLPLFPLSVGYIVMQLASNLFHISDYLVLSPQTPLILPGSDLHLEHYK